MMSISNANAGEAMAWPSLEQGLDSVPRLIHPTNACVGRCECLQTKVAFCDIFSRFQYRDSLGIAMIHVQDEAVVVVNVARRLRVEFQNRLHCLKRLFGRTGKDQNDREVFLDMPRRPAVLTRSVRDR